MDDDNAATLSAQCSGAGDDSGAREANGGGYASAPAALIDANLATITTESQTSKSSRGRKTSGCAGQMVPSRYMSSHSKKRTTAAAAATPAASSATSVHNNTSVGFMHFSRQLRQRVISTPIPSQPVKTFSTAVDRRSAATSTAGGGGDRNNSAPSSGDSGGAATGRRSTWSSVVAPVSTRPAVGNTTRSSLNVTATVKGKTSSRLHQSLPAQKIAFNQYLQWAYLRRISDMNSRLLQQKLQSEASDLAKLVIDTQKKVNDRKRYLHALQQLKQLKYTRQCVARINSQITDQWGRVCGDVQRASDGVRLYSDKLALPTAMLPPHWHDTDQQHDTLIADLESGVRRCGQLADLVNSAVNATASAAEEPTTTERPNTSSTAAGDLLAVDFSSGGGEQQEEKAEDVREAEAVREADGSELIQRVNHLCDTLQSSFSQGTDNVQRCGESISELCSLTLQETSDVLATQLN